MSNFSITLNSADQDNTSDYTTYFANPIELKGLQYQISMTSLNTSYSWYNVSAADGNNIFKYSNGIIDRLLVLDDGVYSFIELVDEIHDMMIILGDYTILNSIPTFNLDFKLDLADAHTSLILSNSYTVNFTDVLIRNIFGFNSQVYLTTTLSERRSDITNGSSSIYVHLNIITGSYINGNPTDVVATFSANGQENQEILILPDSTRFLPINNRSQINNIRIYLTDNKNKLINLNGFPLKAEFIAIPILQ